MSGVPSVDGLFGIFGVNLALKKANEERTAGRGAGGRDRIKTKEGGSYEKPESVKIHQGKVAKITINILKFQ